MGFALSSFLILSGVGIVAALMGWYVLVERPRRHRRRFERALLQQRGEQDAKGFAALFDDESERQVAEKLYPKLQALTVTNCVPLCLDDFLFQELQIDDEDLTDEIDAVLADFGRGIPSENEWETAFGKGVKTVRDLVSAVSTIRRSHN